MDVMRRIAVVSFFSIVILDACPASVLRAQPVDATESPDAIVVRLIHPERQAANLICLFDGAPAPHPAAALAGWKRSTRFPDQLGKPLEAVISFLNPEMVPEWQSLHEAKLSLGIDPESGAMRWLLNAPHDDGTLAALITTLRLSGGSQDDPLGQGKVTVERLGASRAAVAARSAQGLIFASSRAELNRGLSLAGARMTSAPQIEKTLDSGLVFRIEPARLPESAGVSIPLRRAIVLARALGCQTILGRLRLHEDQLKLNLDSSLEPGHPLAHTRARNHSIDLDWLRWVPADHASVLVSVATGQEEDYWNAIFTLADRVDRADPQRTDLAPLRTRINLMTTAASARVEADLWPHLRGLTIVLLADRARPGQPAGALLVLHMDQEASASQLAAETLPRLAVLWGGPRLARDPARGPGLKEESDFNGATKPLGRINGQVLEAAARGRTVLIGWGERSLNMALDSAEHPEHSVLPLVKMRLASENPPVVDRLGLFWPGRVKLPIKGLDTETPLARCIAEGDPIIWTGVTAGEHAFDRVQWRELRPLVKKFLVQVPLNPALTP
jgi:hypothetical protein